MKIALPVALAVTLVSSAAMAQTTTAPPATTTPPATTAPSTTPPAAAPAPSMQKTDGMSLTDQQAKAWVDKTVYSSDGKNVGEVAELRRDSSGKVIELHADVGGFLGLGESRVKLTPSQFKFGDDRVVLNLTGEQVKALPKIAK
ncbi:MAG: PRC-barrel domain-containing protein [Hyphomicrobiaceae bacterium]